MAVSPPVPVSSLFFQLLARSRPSPSYILGDCRAADGNLVWAALLCGRLIFSSCPAGDVHKSRQLIRALGWLRTMWRRVPPSPAQGVREWGSVISIIISRCPCFSAVLLWGEGGASIRGAAGDPRVGEGLCCCGCGRPVSGQTLPCVLRDTPLPGSLGS